MRPEQVVDTQEVLPRNGQLFLAFGTIDDVQLRRTQMKMRMTSGNVLLVFAHRLLFFFGSAIGTHCHGDSPPRFALRSLGAALWVVREFITFSRGSA